MMCFENRKENIYVHWDSIADLTPIFRDASQNPLCRANPDSERPKKRQRRKKVASVVNRFVPHRIFSFYNQLSIFCRKLKAVSQTPCSDVDSANQMRMHYIQN